jgi:nucleoside phosphorylase
MSGFEADERRSGGLLIAAPLRLEALIVRSGASRAGGRVTSGASRARVCVTGMGPERARAAAPMLRGQPGRALLILGFCGALEHGAVPGEVVVAEELLSASDEGHLPERVACVGTDALVARLRGSGLPVWRGPLVCVSRLALGERRVELRERFGAVAVDMESLWLAAGADGRPCGVVRVVLDSPSHELLRPGAAVGRVAAALYDWPPGV